MQVISIMEKYKNKYRIPSARAQWWDYSNPGAYFITICTAYHQCYFGNIENAIMNYSEIGSIAEREWDISFDMRKELFCDAFVIMPNHIHAILRIENDAQTHGVRPAGESNGEAVALAKGIAYRPQKSISSFVGGFKSAVTKYAREIHADYGWHPRFHDHIIRDDEEYMRIANYIMNNPKKWNDDKFHEK